MECVYAERLRNIALVSISRELRILAKLRDSATKTSDLSLRKSQNVIMLRRKTDQDRKVLQDLDLQRRAQSFFRRRVLHLLNAGLGILAQENAPQKYQQGCNDEYGFKSEVLLHNSGQIPNSKKLQTTC